MKKLRILGEILRRTHADKILGSFLIFILLDALVIWIVEPDITRYGDALWYCYAALTTIGFGDVTVTTFIAKVSSVILSIYATLVIAIVTGVVANFYMQIIQLRQKETLANLMDKLENLPEMSKEELIELSNKVKHYRNT